MNIPSYITTVLEILYNNGFEGFLVGGCVRDAMMGKTPHDFDLTTNALPQEMLNVFKDYRIIETGLKHGTVTVVSDGENVEITTYRIDGTYLDNRRPSDVTFTRDLAQDLSRRDFTVNALAYSPRDGLVDEFGGMGDLSSRLIRCVGDPDSRFNEDGLRIMRALRFSSVLGFSIHSDTAASIHSNKHLLRNISAERIYAELKKLICGQGASHIIGEYLDVFETVFPVMTRYCSVLKHNISKLTDVPSSHIDRFATLLYGFSKEDVICFMKSLKPDNYTYENVKILCELSQKPILSDKVSIRRLMTKYDNKLIESLAEIKRCCSNDFCYSEFINSYNIQKALNPCVRLSQLAVTGSDLIELGIKPGPKIGEIMKKILDSLIKDEIENNRENIIEFIKKHY